MIDQPQPLVTVLMPVFNGAKTIQKAINSLLYQTLKDWRCVIVNDGSQDDTASILDTIEDSRFLVIHLEKNYGRPYARQIAMEQVKTNYVAFLDADDWYLPEKLQHQIDFLESNKHITLHCMSMAIIDTEERLKVLLPKKFVGKEEKYSSKHKNSIPHASSVIRKEAIKKSKYNLEITYGEDQDFIDQIMQGNLFYIDNRIGYVYTWHESFSTKKYVQSEFQRLKTIKNLIMQIQYFPIFIFKTVYVYLLNALGKKSYILYRASRLPESSHEMEYKQALTLLESFKN